jgi:glycopeptide antibiotics resistance protein
MWLVAGALVVTCLGVSRAPARYRLVLWTIVIIGGVVPWFSMTGHAHWPRIGWIPFASPPVRLRDIALNLVLYLPFGWFSRPGGRTAFRQVLHASMLACGLALTTEATQVFSHGRFPSMTDVVMNSIGAGLGAMGSAGRRPPSRGGS